MARPVVLFDLDDTLYPERQFVLGGLRAAALAACRRLGGDPEEAFRELRSLSERGVPGRTFDAYLEARRADPELVEELVAAYRSHRPMLALYPGMRRLLARLAPACGLGIVTDGYLEVQRSKVAALGLQGMVGCVVFTDAWGKQAWKPRPLGLLAALERLGGAAGAVYVADNPAKDFLAARRAGLVGLRIRHPGGLHACAEPPSARHAPHDEVGSVDELEAWLSDFSAPGRSRAWA